MDVIQYAAKPESYDRLSAAQIQNFFEKHGAITKENCDGLAVKLLNSSVTPTLVQGATSYTVAADHVPKVVQFRTHKLDMKLIDLAIQSYRGFVPSCVEHGMLGTAYLYVWDLVRGPAFCRVRRQILAPGMKESLQQTVRDFARYLIPWTEHSIKLILVHGKFHEKIGFSLRHGLPGQQLSHSRACSMNILKR